jgi:tetratricopeptide (TPR) repeat protein
MGEAEVIDLICQLLQGIWQRPRPSLVILILLGLIGLGGTLAGRSIWGWYHFQEAERALVRRDFEQAQAHLERCLLVRSSSPETHFLAARAARCAGHCDDAERHLNESQRLGELPERVRLERALLAVGRGHRSPRIERELQYLVEQDHPDSVLILEVLAKFYMKSYQMRLALACLNRWLEREPENTQALMWRADTHERLLMYQDALKDWDQVVAIDPQHDEARQRLAEGLVEANQPAAALAHFEYLARRQPEDTKVMLGLARCRHLLDQLEEAQKLLDALLLASPNDAAALRERGRLALETGRPGEAEQWLRKAWDLAPYERATTYVLFVSLTQLGRFEEAKEFLDKLEVIDKKLDSLKGITRAISDNPGDAALRHQAGLIFLQTGQAKEGLRWLNSALQEDPGYRPAHQALMDYYESIGDEEQAALHRAWLQPRAAASPGLPAGTRPRASKSLAPSASRRYH